MQLGAQAKDVIAGDGGGSADQLIAASVRECWVGGCRRGALPRRLGLHHLGGWAQLGGEGGQLARGHRHRGFLFSLGCRHE